jgi:hypothetical protein
LQLPTEPLKMYPIQKIFRLLQYDFFFYYSFSDIEPFNIVFEVLFSQVSGTWIKVVVPPYLNFFPKFNFVHIRNIDWQ